MTVGAAFWGIAWVGLSHITVLDGGSTSCNRKGRLEVGLFSHFYADFAARPVLAASYVAWYRYDTVMILFFRPPAGASSPK